MPLVVLKVWAWLQKWWKVFLFPIGILLWFAGKAMGKTTIKVASPELVEHMELRKKIDDEAIAKRTEAGVKRDEELKAIEDEHSAKVREAQAEATARTAELRQSPDSLTAFLKKAGKDAGTKPKG